MARKSRFLSKLGSAAASLFVTSGSKLVQRRLTLDIVRYCLHQVYAISYIPARHFLFHAPIYLGHERFIAYLLRALTAPWAVPTTPPGPCWVNGFNTGIASLFPSAARALIAAIRAA